MKKKLIKIMSIIMAMLIALSASTVAFAETDDSSDNEIELRYSTIGTNSSKLTISGINATCSATLTAKYSTTLSIKMELQKKSSGTYSTVKTWTKSANSTGTAVTGSRTINPLSTYRLKVTFKADNETVVTYKY